MTHNSPLSPAAAPAGSGRRRRYAPVMTAKTRDFLAACRKVMAQSRGPIRVREMAVKAAAMPAPAYYMSYEYTLRMLYRRNLSRRCPALAAKLAEIAARVAELQQRRGMSKSLALAHVLAGPSPNGFFLTEANAVRLFHQAVALHRRRPAKDNNI